MSIKIRLIDSDIQIKKKIFEALSEDINKNLKKNYTKAQDRIKSLIPLWIKEQPEIASILDEGVSESLNAQLGFISGTASGAVEAIVFAVSESIKIELDLNNKLNGGVTFYFQPESFSNLLSLPEANILALSGPLPWLNWLLTQGTATIVSGYTYEADNSGRSGGGTMVAGKAWRIPPQFSGTIENNFITRALQNRDKELKSIMEEALYG